MEYEAATVWAENLCSRAEYSSGEISQRLVRKGVSKDVADKIVGELIRKRFIDDARFVRAFVRDKISHCRWGRIKVKNALFKKGVDREIIERILSAINEDKYTLVLRDLLRAKLRSLKSDGSDSDVRARLYRFAASRGFEASVISRAVGMLYEK